jgi:PAS domain S-box-containing protein
MNAANKTLTALASSADPRAVGDGPAASSDAERAHEERFRLLVEHTGVGWWDMDLHGGPLLWSATHFTLLGYEPRPDGIATFEMWESRVHPEDRARVVEAFARASRDDTRYAETYRIIRADDGQIRWLTAIGRVLRDHQGRAVRNIGVLYDDTQRRLAEEHQRESEERFRFTARATQVMLFQQDADLRYTWLVNPIPGYTIEGIIGRTDSELSHSIEDVAGFVRAKQAVLSSGVGAQIEVVNRTAGGATYHEVGSSSRPGGCGSPSRCARGRPLERGRCAPWPARRSPSPSSCSSIGAPMGSPSSSRPWPGT